MQATAALPTLAELEMAELAAVLSLAAVSNGRLIWSCRGLALTAD